MAEGSEGRTRADEFAVDAIVPDLTDLDPELGDLLDLTGPPPEPLPTVGRPPRPEPPAPPPPPVVADEPPPLRLPPLPVRRPPATPPPPPPGGDALEIPDFVAADPPVAAEPEPEPWPEPSGVETRRDTTDSDSRPPEDEPEPDPPRLPTVPVGEPDGFAVQLGADLGADPGANGGAAHPAAGAFTVRAAEPEEERAPQPQPDPDPPAEPVPASSVETVEIVEALDAAEPEEPVGVVELVEPEIHEVPASVAPTPGAAAGPPPPSPALAEAAAPCVEPTPVTVLAPSVPWWRRHIGKAAVVVVAGSAAAALLLTSPGGGGEGETEERATADDRPAPAAAAPDPDTSIVAEATIPLIDVYEAPDNPRPKLSLEHPTEVGGPLVFLVKVQRQDWLEVYLPVPPAGSTGWVKADQARLSKHDYEVVVRLGERRLEMRKGGDEVFHADVAIGARDVPEPGTTLYIKELLKPPNPDTLYGNYAFGLSGFTNSLENFNGSEGVIGIHGTNDAAVIGTDVPEGSIAMRNEDMLELVGTLPLGTPVRILP